MLKQTYNPASGQVLPGESYIESFSTFSGSDIRAVLGGVEIAEIQQISFSVMREKGGNFVLGDPNARSFSRGRRYIAGALMFGFFSQEALLEGTRLALAAGSKLNAGQYYDWKDKGPNGRHGGSGLVVDGIDALDPRRQGQSGAGQGMLENARTVSPRKLYEVRYADQILPFNVTITACNEYGQHTRMAVLGVEIMNMEHGFAIETMQADHRYTFLARELTPWVRGTSDIDAQIFSQVATGVDIDSVLRSRAAGIVNSVFNNV